MEQLLASRSLQRLQLNNFGWRDEHCRTVARALQHNATLQHLQLVARHGDDYSTEAIQTLCDTLQQFNVTLLSCGIWTRRDRNRPQRNYDHPHRLHPQNHSSTELQWQQEHLNLWCFLNQLGRGKLVGAQPSPTMTITSTLLPTMQPHYWWNMIFRVVQNNNDSSNTRHHREPDSVLLLVGREDPSPPPSEEDLAWRRCAMGAIYTLVRSHPQLIVQPREVVFVPNTVPPATPTTTNTRDRSATVMKLHPNHGYGLRSTTTTHISNKRVRRI